MATSKEDDDDEKKKQPQQKKRAPRRAHIAFFMRFTLHFFAVVFVAFEME